MLLRCAVLLCVLVWTGLTGPGPALAGPWPQDKGRGFASTSARLSWPRDFIGTLPPSRYYTLFVEYGLTDKWTLGLDLGRSVSGGSKAVAFAQYPLRDRDDGIRITLALGLGRIDGRQVIRPGLNIGRGFSNDRRAGWMTAEAVAEVDLRNTHTDFKLDLTYGLNLARDRKLILQLQTGAPARRDPFARFAPSVVLPVGNGRHAEIGATYGLTGDSDVGLMLGFWQQF